MELTMTEPDALEALTVSLLRCEDQYLLLQRSEEKSFAPGRWTGIGGHVEADEYFRLRSAALREINEEAGLDHTRIANFSFRRALFVNRPGKPLAVLLYFTGELGQKITPACPEGMLYWKQAGEFQDLDIIETTRPVLNLLVKDMQDDPMGKALPVIGVTVFNHQGSFEKVIWAA